MITDDEFGKAEPQTDRIAERAASVIRPPLVRGRVPVIGGFVGATEHGITTTLGRGGSDYSASLLGAAMGAEAIEIWTDVDGMLTADPRVVPGARLIERIRFDEASELASFGAKVLHPSTIAPAVRLGIPVYDLQLAAAGGHGHVHRVRRASASRDGDRRQEGVTVVKVRSPRMLLAHGFLRAHLRDLRPAPHVGGRRRDVGDQREPDDRRRRAPGIARRSTFRSSVTCRSNETAASSRSSGAGLGADSEAMARAIAALGTSASTCCR